MRFLILTALFVLFQNLGQAQNAVLSGIVLDDQSLPLPDATIAIKTHKNSVLITRRLTNEEGRFTVNLMPGVYDVEVHYIGLITQKIVGVTVDTMVRTHLQINLNMDEGVIEVTDGTTYTFPNFTELDEIDDAKIIAAKKRDIALIDGTESNLGGNVNRQVFAQVAGLIIAENDPSGLQTSIGSRGLNPYRSGEMNMRQNGYDIGANSAGVPEAYYTPPLEAVASIVLIRDASAIQYGTQFGGLVDYKLIQPTAQGFFGAKSKNTIGSYGLINTYNEVHAGRKKWSLFAFYNQKKGDGWRQSSQFDAQTGHLALAYRPSDKVTLTAEITRMKYLAQQAGGLTDAEFNAGNMTAHRHRNWFEVPWNLGALKLDYRPNYSTNVQIQVFGLSGQRNSIGFVQPITVGDNILSSTLGYEVRQIDKDQYQNLGFEIRGQHRFKVKENHQALSFGARIYNGKTQRQLLGIGSTAMDADFGLRGDFAKQYGFDADQAAIFAEQLVSVTSHIKLTLGARIERLDNQISGKFLDANLLKFGPFKRTQHFGSLSFGAEYHLTRSYETYANISSAYRPVTFLELTPPASYDIIAGSLRSPSGYTATWGLRGQTRRLSGPKFDLCAYYIKYNDRIGSLSQAASDGSHYLLVSNLGGAENMGAELTINWHLWHILRSWRSKYGNLRFFVACSYNQSRYLDQPYTTLANSQIETKNLRGNRLEYSPTYLIRGGLSYQFRKFKASMQYQSVSDIFTDAANTDAPTPDGTAGRLEAYQVFDAVLSYEINYRFSAQAGVNNMANTRYATSRSSNYPGPGLMPAEPRTWFVGFSVSFSDSDKKS
jgi:Fe(3+) dicitrate transport protein